MRTTKFFFRNILMIALLILIGSAINTAAATFTVSNTNDSGAGSLRQAVLDANAAAGDDVIEFDPSFNASQTIILGGSEIVIANNGSLTINGPGANLLTVSGNGASRIISTAPGVVAIINDIRFAAGNGVGAANTGRGGAIYNTGGNLTLNNLIITGNTAVNGGGLNNATSGTLNINNCVISNNTALTSSGGGMQNFGGSFLNISNSSITGNTSNSSTGGGGIQGNGTVNITNSTIANNTANAAPTSASGGGITFNGTSLTITSSTISGNTAPTNGGGINKTGTTNSATIRNTIIANNTDSGDAATPDVAGAFISQGNNLIGIVGTATGFTETGDQVGTSNLPIDPLLGSLVNNGGFTDTLALLSGSPAINAGNNALALDLNSQPLTTDQRGIGFPRIVGGTVDIGAYEFMITSTPTPTPSPSPTVTPTPNPSPTPTVTPTPTPTPGNICTPTTTVTEGDLSPGGIVSFGVISGPGSVTVDHVNAGTGLQSLTVIGTPTNATVNIPPFTQGTTDPVTVTFTTPTPGLAVDFTLRAASTFHAANIRVRCAETCTPTTTVMEGDLFPGGIVSFGITSGPGSVTVDHVNAGTGLQSLTIVGTPVNAVVNIPPFTLGTTAPVTVTFTPIDPNQPVDFTLRAASTFHAANIRARCGTQIPRPERK